MGADEPRRLAGRLLFPQLHQDLLRHGLERVEDALAVRGATGALRKGDEILAKRLEEILTGLQGSTIVAVTIEVARISAYVRARYGLRTPDAIHVASAIVAEAAEFVTMDRQLARVKEIDVRVLRASTRGSSKASRR